MIGIDLNYPPFQDDMLALEKKELLALMKTLKKLKQMTWDQIYKDSGLNWESIDKAKKDHYTIRITQKCRAIVKREKNMLRFASIHPDHDSAYKG